MYILILTYSAPQTASHTSCRRAVVEMSILEPARNNISPALIYSNNIQLKTQIAQIHLIDTLRLICIHNGGSTQNLNVFIIWKIIPMFQSNTVYIVFLTYSAPQTASHTSCSSLRVLPRCRCSTTDTCLPSRERPETKAA